VRGTLKEQRYGVQGHERGEVERVLAPAGQIAVYFIVDAVAEIGLLVEAAFDVDGFALRNVSFGRGMFRRMEGLAFGKKVTAVAGERSVN